MNKEGSDSPQRELINPNTLDKNFSVRMKAYVERKMKEAGYWDKILSACKDYEDYEKTVHALIDSIGNDFEISVPSPQTGGLSKEEIEKAAIKKYPPKEIFIQGGTGFIDLNEDARKGFIKGLEYASQFQDQRLREENEKLKKDLEASKSSTSASLASHSATSGMSVEQVLEDALLGLQSAKAIIEDTGALFIDVADNGAKADCWQNLLDAICSVQKIKKQPL
jgi:Zn-dependent M16 (insulinase) family peptidase